MVDRLIGSLFFLTCAFSAACLLVMILREPCRRLAGSAFAYWIWLLVPLAVVAALLPALPHAQASMVAPAAGLQAASQALPAVAAVQGVEMAAKAAEPLLKVLVPWLAGAWGIGLLAFLGWIVWLQTRFVQGLGRLTRDPGRANVFYSEKTGVSPSVIGMLKSRIILPADFARVYQSDEQVLIMAHERTHVRERHPAAGAVGVLLVAVQWFNPLAYLALSLFRIDQELACDAAVVVAHPDERATYAKAMLKARIGGDNPPLAYCWISRLSLPMKDRIGLLRLAPPSPQRRLAAVSLLALMATGGAVTAYAMVPHAEISLHLGGARSPLATVQAPMVRTIAAVAPAPSSVTTVQGGFSSNAPRRRAEPLFDLSTKEGRYRQAALDRLKSAIVQKGARLEAPLTAIGKEEGAMVRKVMVVAPMVAGADHPELVSQIVNSDSSAQRTALSAAEVMDGPDSFPIPASMSPDEAARAVGLASASGYGRLRTPAGAPEVMVKCTTPQAANARCV